MTRLDIFALGAFRISVDQRPIVSLTSKKAQTLFVYLASYRQRRHSRALLAGLFWPEIDDTRARASLRVELHKIRRTLAEAGLAAALYADDQSVQLLPDAAIWLDSISFSEGVTHGFCTSTTLPLDALVRATALYQGDFLAGTYDEWVLAERDRLGLLYEEGLRCLVSTHLAGRAFDHAIAYARLSLARNPLQEEVHRDLIYAYAASGQRTKAYAQYRACAALLAEELGIEPARETHELLALLEARELPATVVAAFPATTYDLGLPLIGRQHELMRLQYGWQRLHSGQGGLFIVEGEPGIGKSRLLNTFAAAISDSGIPVIRSRCYDLERDIVYQPLVEALRSRADLLDRAILSGMPPAYRTSLAALFPDLVTHSDQRAPVSTERERQSDALFWLLTRVAEAQPGLLLLIDDLHWADTATIEALHYVGRRLTGVSLLIICATRDDDGADAVHRLQRALGREIPGECVRLERLDASEVLALMSHMPGAEGLSSAQSEALAARIFAATAGNPFFAIEMLRVLTEDGRLTDAAQVAIDGTTPIPLPRSLREAIGQLLRPLNPATRSVLNLAAAIGKGFAWSTLLCASAQDQDLLLLALEELLSRRIIRTRDGTWYEFDHETVREVVYEELAPPRRRRLHSMIARALEQEHDASDQHAATLAYHYAASDQPRSAVPYLLQAGDMARRLQAYAEAERHYQRAATLLSEHGEEREAAEVWMKLALNALAAGRWEAAATFNEHAFGVWSALHSPTLPALHLADSPDATFRLVSSFSAIGSLDPSYSASRASWRVIVQLFEGLVQLDPRMHLVPGLAERWEVLDGGRLYRFHLRRDRVWSDGTPITATDVLFAWRRNVRLASTTSLVASLFDIAGAAELAADPTADPTLLAASACAPHLLEVHLRAPARHFLYAMAMPIAFPLPAHAVAAHGAAWAEPDRLVTSGPYRLTAWEPGRWIVLERSPTYQAPFPGNVGRAELLIEPSATKRIELYQRGSIDMIADLTPQEYAWARRTCPGNLVARSALTTSFLAFSWRSPPFDCLSVRMAFAMAVDRERWARTLHGAGTPGARGGFVPPGIAGHTPELPMRFDPVAARRLLAEAGYPDGHGLKGLTMASITGFEESDRYIVEQWREHLGVEVTLDVVEAGTLITRWLEGVYPIIQLSRSASYPDPDNWLRYAVIGLQALPSTDPAHTLLREASLEAHDTLRNERYRALDRLLVSERFVVLPFSYEQFYWLAQPWLAGYHFGPFSHWTSFKTLQLRQAPDTTTPV